MFHSYIIYINHWIFVQNKNGDWWLVIGETL